MKINFIQELVKNVANKNNISATNDVCKIVAENIENEIIEKLFKSIGTSREEFIKDKEVFKPDTIDFMELKWSNNGVPYKNNEKVFVGYTGPFPNATGHEFDGLKKSLEQDAKLWKDKDMIVDNTSKLKDILVFKPNTYYKFVVLLREKDGKTLLKSYNKKELIVRQWLVDSQEKLDEMLPDMITFAKLFGGRLYVTTDRKSVYKTLFYMQDMINAYIKQMFCGSRTEISVKQLNKLLASASSSSECTDGDRYFLFDVDTKDKYVVDNIIKLLKNHYVSTYDTPNGYHILAKRDFDINKLIKENNLVNIKIKH